MHTSQPHQPSHGSIHSRTHIYVVSGNADIQTYMQSVVMIVNLRLLIETNSLTYRSLMVCLCVSVCGGVRGCVSVCVNVYTYIYTLT